MNMVMVTVTDMGDERLGTNVQKTVTYKIFKPRVRKRNLVKTWFIVSLNDYFTRIIKSKRISCLY
jgi:hypothetical protein